MTDDKRELTEWVARWVGGEALGIDYDIWSYNLSENEAKMLLADEALAWRAREELIAKIGTVPAAADVEVMMRERQCDRIEATHRANRLRAAKGEG